MEDQESELVGVVFEGQDKSEHPIWTLAEKATCVGGRLGDHILPIFLHFHGYHDPRVGPVSWHPTETLLDTRYSLSSRNVRLEGRCTLDTFRRWSPNNEFEVIVPSLLTLREIFLSVKGSVTRRDASGEERGENFVA